MSVIATESLLSDDVRSFLDCSPPRYATIATVNPDGSPHQTVIWFELRDDLIIVNSRVGRRWPSNLLRNSRAAMCVYDRADGVAIDCKVVETIDGEEALAAISAMAFRYCDTEEAEELIVEWRRQRRLTFVLRPVRIHTAGDPS
ncbi:MAG TPA: pyridoxamine 5'-phosphate oxidase family protein [Candidatus Limnocylindrales bacterium]|nr:pyridoxamine 5'-phosphate oxidase family protein [Candidatus Limnocylindrales bacterium]